MAVLTLSTDLKSVDPLLVRFRAMALRTLPQTDLLVLATDLPPFDIGACASILSGNLEEFPEGTVHILDCAAHRAQPIWVTCGSQHLIAADNGLIPLVLGSKEYQARSGPPSTQKSLFPLIQWFWPIAYAVITKAAALQEFKPVQINERILPQPMVRPDQIVGQVVRLDSYGNALTNIRREVVDQWAQGKNYSIRLRGYENLDRILSHYSEVADGEKLALFGLDGFLEIAINMGSAAQLLGLSPGDKVLLEKNA